MNTIGWARASSSALNRRSRLTTAYRRGRLNFASVGAWAIERVPGTPEDPLRYLLRALSERRALNLERRDARGERGDALLGLDGPARERREVAAVRDRIGLGGELRDAGSGLMRHRGRDREQRSADIGERLAGDRAERARKTALDEPREGLRDRLDRRGERLVAVRAHRLAPPRWLGGERRQRERRHGQREVRNGARRRGGERAVVLDREGRRERAG